MIVIWHLIYLVYWKTIIIMGVTIYHYLEWPICGQYQLVSGIIHTK